MNEQDLDILGYCNQCLNAIYTDDKYITRTHTSSLYRCCECHYLSTIEKLIPIGSEFIKNINNGGYSTNI